MCLIDMMIEIAGHFTFVSLEILSLAISFTVSIVNRRRRWHLQGALPSFWTAFPPSHLGADGDVGSVVISCKCLYFRVRHFETGVRCFSRDTLLFSMLMHGK